MLRVQFSNIQKKIIAQETVTVPAGTFNCYKIQVIYSYDTTIERYDYIAPQGLIKRTTKTETTVTNMNNYVENVATVTITQVFEATQVDIK